MLVSLDMFNAYNYLNIFSAPLACYFAIGKGPLWAIGCFLLAFAVHPIIDWLMNRPFNKIVLSLNSKTKNKFWYELPLLLAVPFQILLVIHAFKNGSNTLQDALLSGALCGLSGGILGIGTSHELIHRSSKWLRQYGKLMLFTINYPHFYIEHLWHHVSIGTDADADTGKEGESIYRFLIRSIPQGWMQCWKWKKFREQMLKTTAIQITLFLILFALGGVNVLIVFLIQGLVTLCLLKWINYVEHYGLKRKMIDGKLEPVGTHHSWDSLSPLTNFSLFNLGYHSHHHAKPSVEYHALPEATPNWNSLPSGYSSFMMLALIPAAWKKVMRTQLDLLEKRHG